MKINAALNLVIPVRYGDDGETVLIRAYHSPLSTESFEASYRIIAATRYALWGKGTAYAAHAGIRIARLALIDAARADAIEQGYNPDDPDSPTPGASLLAELKRLTTIIYPGKVGFENLPVDVALQQHIIESEEWLEALSSIVFFTCSLLMEQMQNRKQMALRVGLALQGSTTSLSPMEFSASLAISTKAETTEQESPQAPEPEASLSSIPS